MNLIEILKQLNIEYEIIEHQAVFTVEEAKHISNRIDGIGCKNLFLANKKEKYFLVILKDDKKANIKEIEKIINTSHLSFANKDKLKEIIGLERGSVTPFGIINDIYNKVTILIDKELQNKKLLFHPNRNTATISVSFQDLIKFIDFEEHKYILI